MAINIKNERVSKLAVELADKTGESITDAVGIAIQEKLDRLANAGGRKGIADKMRAISQEIAARAPRKWSKWDWERELYDDQTGLPR